MARILIIDDEVQIRTLLKHLLVQEGHKIAEAHNGKIGMQLQREMPADLVITDIVMPEQEGLETIIKLRREFPQTAILAMSGGGEIGSENYLSMANKLGVRGTFQKPLNLKELLSAVKECLKE